MKKFYILFVGESSNNHLSAVSTIMQIYKQFFAGCEFIPFEKDGKSFTNTMNNLLAKDVEPIIMKGFNIHTEDYIRTIINYYKSEHPKEKFFLSHCAVFDNFILTDGALLTKYTQENIGKVIANAVYLRDLTSLKFSKNIAMLNAGGDTNPNTAPDYWLEIYNSLPKETDKYKLEMTQLDVALDEQIRKAKLHNEENTLPTIIIPSCINEANSIWKTLTVVAKQFLAGIVVGLPLYIGLTSRTDSEESIFKTLNLLITLFQDKKD